jgi:hypothetical protein
VHILKVTLLDLPDSKGENKDNSIWKTQIKKIFMTTLVEEIHADIQSVEEGFSTEWFSKI